MLYFLEPLFSCLEILMSYYLTEWIATTTRSEENVGEGECNIARFFFNVINPDSQTRVKSDWETLD